VKETIDDPVGEAVVYWRTAAEGGRSTGPSTAPVYTAQAVFVLGGENEVQPGWPVTADPKLSAWVERIAVRDDGSWLRKIDFPVRDLAKPYIVPGGEFLFMEGRHVVATAQFTSVKRHVVDW
jgi:hypothetical protein